VEVFQNIKQHNEVETAIREVLILNGPKSYVMAPSGSVSDEALQDFNADNTMTRGARPIQKTSCPKAYLQD
jgi:hypothetical protein